MYSFFPVYYGLCVAIGAERRLGWQYFWTFHVIEHVHQI